MEMSGDSSQKLEGPQLASVEAQLHALLRKQAKSNVPMELPRPDFWHMCSRLLQTIEIELAEIGRTEGWSVRAQTLSRRQANLRHTIADLTRHRLAAFVNHAALSNLASTPFGDAAPNDSTNVVPIDWQRHDGAERAFHAGVAELINQYKQNISWDVLQKGVLSSNEAVVMTPAGNSQLDDFVDEPGGLTGNEPPLVEPESEGVWEDPEIDEEDRIAMAEEFPEIEEHVPVSPEINITTEEVSTEESDMKRIRILQDMPEPIVDASGEEIELFEGDIHNCNSILADTLISAGFAEAAEL